MMAGFQACALCILIGFIASGLHGCGGGSGPSPSPPRPTPAPTPPPPANIAPDPANMTFVIPSSSNFHCIRKTDPPPGNRYAQGFFMYRWSTRNEAESQKVNSDDLGDINPYYLLTELMTNL